jgi:hypothetical protein
MDADIHRVESAVNDADELIAKAPPLDNMPEPVSPDPIRKAGGNPSSFTNAVQTAPSINLIPAGPVIDESPERDR